MLFRKNIDPCCAYCEYGRTLSETEVGCVRRGVVSSGGSCGKFKYDPLKREPPRPAIIETDRYTEEDFTL